MIFGLYDGADKSFQFARAGHNPLILVRGNGESVELVQSKGIALGMIVDERFEQMLECLTLNLSTGDTIILYTDGYTEAMNYGNKLYGERRLVEVVQKHAGLAPDMLLAAINQDVRVFMGERPASDDMTMIVMRIV
jgi:serine phosphatase RsbU (regulator of sigma subunit)